MKLSDNRQRQRPSFFRRDQDRDHVHHHGQEDGQPVTTHRGFPHRTPSVRPAAPMPKKPPPPTPTSTLETDDTTTSTTSSGAPQFGDRIIRDSTPFRGRRDSSERETSPRNKLVRPKAPPTQLMHSNLEDTTRAKTKSPTTTTWPSMTNPAGSTTTIPTPLAPSMPSLAKFPPAHLPKPQGAAGRTAMSQSMTRGTTNHPRTLSPKAFAYNRSLEHVDIGVGACGVELAKQHGAGGRSQASTCKGPCMVGSSQQHPDGKGARSAER